jgi:phage tail-like protein
MPKVRLHTRDPLRAFNFTVWSIPFEGEPTMLVGVQKVSGLTTSVSVYETWEGGNNLHRYANPDKVTWDPITLEQGLALDDSLERWANAVVQWSRTGRPPKDEPVKRYLRIDVHDPADPRFAVAPPSTPSKEPVGPKSAGAPSGGAIRRYLVRNAWISKYVALPRLDALSQEVALLSVELVHEGWELQISST